MTFDTSFLISTVLIGYIQHVTNDQQSKASSNLYYDATVQISTDEFKVVRVMHQRGEGSKRQLFVDKMHSQQPVKLSNLQSASSGTIFFNKGASIENIPSHKVNFTFSPKQACEVTKIDTLIKYNSGTFNVSGRITWKGPAQHPKEASTKLVRDAVLTDSTGSLPLSVWENQIDAIQDGQFYNLTQCRLRHYYGKCLSTSKSTTVTEAEAQDVTSRNDNKLVNWVCCPEILNAGANVFLACNTKDCRKKVNNAPGSKVVKCNSCSRSMLVKNCFVDMSVNMEIEKDGKVFSVTAFPKVLTAFLKEDMFQYREDVNSLEMKLLTLENVDFNLNQSGKIVKQLLPHSDSQEHQIDCNNTDATG